MNPQSAQTSKLAFAVRYITFVIAMGIVTNIIYDYLKGLNELSVVFCTFSAKSDKDITKGTVYSVGYGEDVQLKLEMHVTPTFGGKTTTVHMIVNSMRAYLWRNSEKHGVKFFVVTQTVGDQIAQFVDKLVGKHNIHNFKCADYVVSTSMFDVPTNITFTETGHK